MAFDEEIDIDSGTVAVGAQKCRALALPERKASHDILAESGPSCLGRRMEDLSLTLRSQPEDIPDREAVHTLESIMACSAQYRRVATTALSQQARLLNTGKLVDYVGYDQSDPWLVDDTESAFEDLRLGSPICITGVGEMGAFLGRVPARSDHCSVRHLRSGVVMTLQANQLQVLPTRAPLQGETAILVGLEGEHSNLNGVTCFCGAYARNITNPPGVDFWVTYHKPDSSPPEDAESAAASMGMMQTSLTNLAALPDPPIGAPSAALDAHNAPAFALPPLAATLEEEAALFYSKKQTLAIMMDEVCLGGPEPTAATEALTALRSAMGEAESRLPKFEDAPPNRQNLCREVKPTKEELKLIEDEPPSWALECALRAARLGYFYEDASSAEIDEPPKGQLLRILDQGEDMQQEPEKDSVLSEQEMPLPRSKRRKGAAKHQCAEELLGSYSASSEGKRKIYMCPTCKVPKKGHVCPAPKKRKGAVISITAARVEGPGTFRKRLRRVRFRLRGKQPDIVGAFK